MTIGEWLGLAQFLLLGAATVMVWIMGRDREASVSRAVMDQQIAQLRSEDKQLRDENKQLREELAAMEQRIEKRLDRAGQKASDLSDQFYRVFEQARTTFAEKDRLRDLEDDVKRLRSAMDASV